MFKIIAGNICKTAVLKSQNRYFYLETSSKEEIKLSANIERIEIMTEEKAKSFLGSAGLGIVGGLVFGPIGALAGILAGGNKREVCFACYLKDGRKFMAITDPKTYQKLATLAF